MIGKMGVLMSIAFFMLSFTDPIDIPTAFLKGNWQQISAQCGTRTQLEFNGKDGLYTAQEIAVSLKSFFKYHPAQNCQIIQNHESIKKTRIIKLKYTSDNRIFTIQVYITTDKISKTEITSIIIQ